MLGRQPLPHSIIHIIPPNDILNPPLMYACNCYIGVVAFLAGVASSHVHPTFTDSLHYTVVTTRRDGMFDRMLVVRLQSL